MSNANSSSFHTCLEFSSHYQSSHRQRQQKGEIRIIQENGQLELTVAIPIESIISSGQSVNTHQQESLGPPVSESSESAATFKFIEVAHNLGLVSIRHTGDPPLPKDTLTVSRNQDTNSEVLRRKTVSQSLTKQ